MKISNHQTDFDWSVIAIIIVVLMICGSIIVAVFVGGDVAGKEDCNREKLEQLNFTVINASFTTNRENTIYIQHLTDFINYAKETNITTIFLAHNSKICFADEGIMYVYSWELNQ